MPLRIALLGNAQAQGERLSRHLAVPYEYVGVAAGGPPVAVDVAVAMRFSAAEATQVRPGLLQVSGAGLDAISFDALPPECWVCNVFEHESSIAEFTMLAMLDHAINRAAMEKAFRFDGWAHAFFDRPLHEEIAGKTVGLIGFGHIGKAIAVRARAFGMRIAAVASSERADALADWIGGPEALPRLLREADFLVVACPLSAATRDLIGAAELQAMKPGALLINIARAEIVAEEALYRALGAKRIAGAVLDTWYAYPSSADDKTHPSRFRFDELPTVRATAHSSALTASMFERRFAAIAANIERFSRGEPLLNVVRPPLVSWSSTAPAIRPQENSDAVHDRRQ